MAATYTVVQSDRVNSIGSLRVIEATITAAGTYTATGDVLDLAALLGLSRLDTVLFDGPASVPGGSGTTAAVPAFDYTNKKLKFYGGAASGAVLAELTAATSVAGFVCRCLVIGV